MTYSNNRLPLGSKKSIIEQHMISNLRKDIRYTHSQLVKHIDTLTIDQIMYLASQHSKTQIRHKVRTGSYYDKYAVSWAIKSNF